MDHELIQARRARQLALAIIKRAKDAGIPDKYSRINEMEFSELLEPLEGNYNNAIKKFSRELYNNPEVLLKREFITIDGGNPISRIKAGFAVLFRIIAYDKVGLYKDCDELINKFQTINYDGMTRNEIVDDIKTYDALFIGEVNKNSFNPHFESGRFFDELLTYRVNNTLPTVLSFVNPILDKTNEQKAKDGDLSMSDGKHLAFLRMTNKTNESILRIRVKNI